MLQKIIEKRNLLRELDEDPRARTGANSKIKKDLPCLPASHFNFIMEAIGMLKKFFEETMQISKETATASVYIPTLKSLALSIKNHSKNWEDFSQEFREFLTILSTEIKRRMAEAEENQLLRMAMLIDPRFSHVRIFASDFEWSSIVSEFCTYLSTRIIICIFNKKVMLF